MARPGNAFQIRLVPNLALDALASARFQSTCRGTPLRRQRAPHVALSLRIGTKPPPKSTNDGRTSQVGFVCHVPDNLLDGLPCVLPHQKGGLSWGELRPSRGEDSAGSRHADRTAWENYRS